MNKRKVLSRAYVLFQNRKPGILFLSIDLKGLLFQVLCPVLYNRTQEE